MTETVEDASAARFCRASGAECCELYIKENGLEFIADEIREAYHAGYIKACRKRVEK